MTIPPVVISDSYVYSRGYREVKEKMWPVRVSLEGVKEEEEGFSSSPSEMKAWEGASISTILYRRSQSLLGFLYYILSNNITGAPHVVGGSGLHNTRMKKELYSFMDIVNIFEFYKSLSDEL